MNNNYSKVIDDFFQNVKKEILPSFIITDNLNIHKEISIVKEMFEDAEKKIKNDNDGLGGELFRKFFEEKMKEISNYLHSKIKDPNSMYELSPTLSEIENLYKKISLSIMLKTYEKDAEQRNLPVIKKLSVLNSLNFIKNKIFPQETAEHISNIKEDIWESLAKDSLNKLVKDFELKSLTIMGEHPWSELYTWANDTYRVIKDSQENIGLSQKSAGLNGTLNLCYSPDSLFYKSSYGSMLTHEFSNTIILTQQPYHIQKMTWQHEYTHALDNRAGIQYFKDINVYSNEHKDSTIFLSEIETSRYLKDLTLNLSENISIKQAQIWTSEAMSMIINGKSAEDFKIYQQEAESKFLNDVSRYIVISILPEQEKTWLDFEINTQVKILKDPAIQDFTKYLSLTLFQKGENFLNEENNINTIKEKINNFSKIICSETKQTKETFIINSLNIIEKNKEQFTIDLNSYINKHSYSFDGHKSYFPTSDSIKSARIESLINKNVYWLMPIEILARASENLQQPLTIGTKKYHDENHDINQLVPQLNKDERLILINTIQSMAKSIGLTIVKEPENVKSVEKELNYHEDINFSDISVDSLKCNSTACGDEDVSKVILNVAKLRAANARVYKNRI